MRFSRYVLAATTVLAILVLPTRGRADEVTFQYGPATDIESGTGSFTVPIYSIGDSAPVLANIMSLLDPQVMWTGTADEENLQENVTFNFTELNFKNTSEASYNFFVPGVIISGLDPTLCVVGADGECGGNDSNFTSTSGVVTYFTSGSIAPAPEPGTIALLFSGLAGLGLVGGMKRRRGNSGASKA